MATTISISLLVPDANGPRDMTRESSGLYPSAAASFLAKDWSDPRIEQIAVIARSALGPQRMWKSIRVPSLSNTRRSALTLVFRAMSLGMFLT